MIRGSITFKSHGMKGPELRAAIKEELSEIGLKWHRDILPGHFETWAAPKYHYTRRSAKYLKGKLRGRHGSRPLVYWGQLEAQVTRMAKVSSTSKGVKVVLSGPRYLYMYRKGGERVDKAAELTATTQGEAKMMANLLESRMVKRLNAQTEVKTVSI